MESKWEIIKKFVNSNEAFTRKQLSKIDGFCNTYDQYINLLRNANFIKRIKPVQYKTIAKIPEKLSTNFLTELAYNKDLNLKYFRKFKLNKLKES